MRPPGTPLYEWPSVDFGKCKDAVHFDIISFATKPNTNQALFETKFLLSRILAIDMGMSKLIDVAHSTIISSAISG